MICLNVPNVLYQSALPFLLQMEEEQGTVNEDAKFCQYSFKDYWSYSEVEKVTD